MMISNTSPSLTGYVMVLSSYPPFISAAVSDHQLLATAHLSQTQYMQPENWRLYSQLGGLSFPVSYMFNKIGVVGILSLYNL